MKKVSIILAMAFMPLLASAYQKEINGIFYELDMNWNNDLDRYEYKATVIRNNQWSNKDNDYIFVPYSGSVVIPETVHDDYTYTVTTIGSSAFSECPDLTSVTIPSTVTTIGKWAFSGCTSLASIDFQGCVIEIPSGAFDDTPWYENQPEGLIYIGKIAYKYKGIMPDNTSIEIKDGTTCITGGAFANCTGLTSVTIPNSVTAIGISAFEGCTNLSALTIPDGVTSIGSLAFSGCTSLSALTIPKGVTSIGGNAFDDCGSVTFLSDQTVKGCIGINGVKGPKSIIIGNEVTTIRNNKTVTGIFRGVKNLTSVTIGLGVTDLHDAFGCMNLTDVYCLSESVPSAYESFGYWKETRNNEGYILDREYVDYAPNITLHVPESAIETYSKANPWKNFKEIVPLTDENNQIERCATPTIEFVNGEFILNCATEGAEIHYEISNVNQRTGTASKIVASPAFTLSVYAKKKGYYNSETATVTFTGKYGDVNNDGYVNVADHVELSNIIMEQK